MSKYLKDCLAGLLFLCFGILILILLPSQIAGGGAYGEEVGPGYVPKGMALAMVIFSSLLIIKAVIKKEFWNELKDLRISLPSLEIFGVIALIAAWVFSLFYLNYLVVTIPFVILALMLFQTKKKANYLIAISFVLILFVVFRFLLNVRLP
jgi:hypothetical protein